VRACLGDPEVGMCVHAWVKLSVRVGVRACMPACHSGVILLR